MTNIPAAIDTSKTAVERRADVKQQQLGQQQSIRHSIPHRFHAYIAVAPSECGICHKFIWVKQGMRCKDCGFLSHRRCLASVRPNCGLTVDMINSAMLCVELREELQKAEQEILMDSSLPKKLSQEQQLTSGVGNVDNKSPISPMIDACEWIDNYAGEQRRISECSKPVASNLQPHDFKSHTFMQPVPCALCNHAIWGVSDRGVHCDGCGVDVHQKCLASVTAADANSTEANNIPASVRSCDRSLVVRLSRHEGMLNKTPVEGNPGEYEIVGNQVTLPRRVGTLNDRSGGKTTMQRLARHTFMAGTDSDSARLAPSAAIPAPQSNSSGADSVNAGKQRQVQQHINQFQRRVHAFRGHEFVATYLENLSGSQFDCQRCAKALGDNGVQCYQCRLCKYYCHKKCYTRTEPCAETIKSFKNEQKDECEQAGLLQHQITTLGRRNPSFVEDFSDELISVSTSTAAAGKKDDGENPNLFDYVVEDSNTLGSGQYGVVKRGHYRNNVADKFAVKIIPKKRLRGIPARSARSPLTPTTPDGANGKASPDARLSIPELLKKELDILKRLDHPGIVRMHHCVDLPEQTWIVMDLADGGDLLDYVMKRTKLAESETKFLMRQVVLAMQYLHDHGIVHRDLKPENILLSTASDGRKLAKIADFGFSTIIQKVGIDRHALQSVVGTPAYMAPEITDSRVWRYVDGAANSDSEKKGYDGSADMWSLGVVFYVCLGGVFPFDSARPVLDQILRGEFYFPDENFGDVSDEVIELICKLLVINPNKRLNCSHLLQQPWFHVK